MYFCFLLFYWMRSEYIKDEIEIINILKDKN